MSELKNIPLSNISMIKNYREVEPISEKDPDILELADSIKEHDVMQAILVRPGKKTGAYELIFGHRRFVASKVAGKTDIPANIKEVADDQILEYQVTENMQRKDVHPMDEAVAFKSLQKKYKYTTEEIGLRFGKKQDYIIQRLKLNDLIPEAQARFKAKGTTMLLGHAILIARLTQEDQKILVKEYGDFGSVPNLEKHIATEIMRDLSKASFDTKDTKLFPKAGACTTCPKRSGCQPLLFSDIKSPDKCMDSTCFATKTNAAFKIKLTDVINNKPDVLIIHDPYSSVAKEINNFLQGMKVEPKKNYNDFQESKQQWNNYTVPAKGLWINGSKRGTISTIYLKGTSKGIKAAAGGEVTKESAAELIKGIQERQARAKVLDSCKVHHAIIDALKDRPELEDKIFPWQPVDRAIMVYLLLSIAGLENDEIKTLPMIEAPDGRGYHEEWFKNLANVTDDQLALIIRITVNHRFTNRNLQYGVSEKDTPIKLIAEYLGIDTKAILRAQDEKSAKRTASADQRIAELKKTEKKVVKTPVAKVPTLKKLVKPAAKKGEAKKK